MLQGTGSSVGKSLLVAGLGRALRRRGLGVAPFKPQNMSNNAAVTVDGGEIGRAQALQARACGLSPLIDMNPVLLKPERNGGAEVIVHGHPAGHAGARQFQDWKPGLLPRVRESFARLAARHDIVLVEGAGSASEVNLRAGDIANMGFARAEGVPVVVVGDIDRGGVIASLVGTDAVLAPDDRKLVRGFVVNRMRGDPTLFASGMDLIGARTGWRPYGLVPFFPDAATLPREDGLDLRPTAPHSRPPGARTRVAVPLLPFTSNSDDLDPLAAAPDVDLLLLPLAVPLPADADAVLLAGSKAVGADLAALRDSGWDHDIIAHRRRGGRVLGLCGGYQMLGTTLHDPDGREGPPGTAPGLGLLAVETVFGDAKHLRHASRGRTVADDRPVGGYEIHRGRTDGPDARDRPFARLDDGTADGARSPDGRVVGTYLHGVLATAGQRAAWLGHADDSVGDDDRIETVLDALAAHLEQHLDVDGLLALARSREHGEGG